MRKPVVEVRRAELTWLKVDASFFHSYISFLQLLSPCLAADAGSQHDGRTSARVVRYTDKAGTLLAVKGEGESAKLVDHFTSFEFQCGAEMPVAAFSRSLATALDVVRRYARVVFLLASLPAGFHIASSLCAKPPSMPIPRWGDIARCAPQGAGGHCEAVDEGGSYVLATATDTSKLHAVFAASLVPASYSELTRLRPGQGGG